MLQVVRTQDSLPRLASSLLAIPFGILFILFASCQSTELPRRDHNFDTNWLFSLDANGEAFEKDTDDASWRSINLPHDWSVEFPFDSINGEGCTAYLPGGIGWYRKHFTLDSNSDQLVFIHFDGVYNNAEFWLNGVKLGTHPYGYSPFYLELTPHLTQNGQDNVLAVKVDRSRYADSRWYPGAGIYRKTKLITVPKIHIPIWGTFITTPQASQQSAQVSVQTQLKNLLDEDKPITLKTKLFAPDGSLAAESEISPTLPGQGEQTLTQVIDLENPDLWDLDQPNRYEAVSEVWLADKMIDQYTTEFGIRSFKFDKDLGFFLNGVNHKIKGVCLHHDGGLVGAAVPKGVWRRRLLTLKAGGCNAIRVSHNPASDEFLDLCDELGFLVQDEFFDEWDYPKDKRLNMGEKSVDFITRGYTEHFQKWAESDLKNTVLSHRNHPSIIQWSIGNEIEWTYPREAASTGFFDANWSGNYFWSQPPYSVEKIQELHETLPRQEYDIGTTAKKLAAWTRELDTTRPVIGNCILPSASYESGYADALDIIGYSYRRVMYDYGHQNYPELPVMGTENLGQYHEWKAVMERPFVAGTFLWTGIDYLGESNKRWPQKATSSGLLDLAGFRKPAFYMMKSLWSEEPTLFMSTQHVKRSKLNITPLGEVIEKTPGAWKRALWGWHDVNQHWNYSAGDTIIVEILSNVEKIELSLNGNSLGQKALSDFEDHIYKWAVPYSPGELIAKGVSDDEEISAQLITATEPASIVLTLDKMSLEADGEDVTHATVQLTDEAGNPVRHAEREIQISLSGDLKLLGLDNGAPDNVQPFQANKITTDQGRALLILQSGFQSGKSTLSVSGKDLEGASATIQINKP